MHEYGKTNWEGFWEALEQEGNVGLDHFINPYLYPEITGYLAARQKSLVVDFGCGTNLMGIQLLFGYIPSVYALQHDVNIDAARFNTLLYLGIEGSHELVNQSNKYLRDIGEPKNIATIQSHIDKNLGVLFDDNSIDLCVSRNFLMHLSPDDLESHFAYVAKILKTDSLYIFSTLNPGYELQKAGKHLSNGEKYDFLHGKDGEYGTFFHFYKTQEFYSEVMKKHFHFEKRIICLPVTDTYRETHARYYNKDIPIAHVYVVRKK